VRAALLSVHVLAAVLTVGPVTVAASMFPRFARAALTGPGSAPAGAALTLLHRICRVYAVVGLFVPVFGLATAASLGVLTDAWLLVSIALTVLAAVLLVARILPAQRRALVLVGEDPAATPAGLGRSLARLSATTGVFALLWVVVTVLMIVRPGSTTGV
jgi:hypothetical protein